MAVQRSTPYSVFNYLVELGDTPSDAAEAGFSEISGLNAEVTVAEYRAGNAPVNYVAKLAGLHKAGDVTLKRGVIGAKNIYDWLEKARSGKVGTDLKKNVVVKLLSEDRQTTAVSWKLINAMPIKWTGPTLTGKGGTDVAMEELVLSVETIEQL